MNFMLVRYFGTLYCVPALLLFICSLFSADSFPLTYNFLLALNSCALFEVKLIKWPPARWITETTKNEINKKYILSHEYESIVDGAAKLQKETEYKQQKMVVRKLIKK